MKKYTEKISDDVLINGSGLFNWNSSLSKDSKLKIVNWYNSLTKEERQYVDDLRSEAMMDEMDGFHSHDDPSY